MDTEQGLSIEELTQLLQQYFYTKEEQKEMSSQDVKESVDSSNELILKLDEIKQIESAQLHIQYFNTVVVAGVFILFLYYRFLSHFRERWF